MRYWWLLVTTMLLCGVVSAVPTTGAATAIGNNNVTFNGAGITGTTGWFQFGEAVGTSYAHTKNITAIGGAINFTMKGSPLVGNNTFYYRACDPTGCGTEISFVVAQVTPLPATTFGIYAQNMTENQLDTGNFLWNSLQPYMAVTGATVFYALIFSMIFIGIWLRTRQTGAALQLGVICSALFCSAAVGLQLGMPPEFVAAAQALMYIGIAGAVVSFTFK